MQKIILVILIPFFSIFWSPDGDDLNKMLKEAQQLEQQRKYKSAAELAVKVQDLAREKQEDIVFIQALELEIKAQRWFGYETFHMALDRIDKAIDNPFGRTEILLRTFKISGYHHFFNRNQYQLRNNLNDGILNEEPKQWSKEDIWKLTDIELKAITQLNSSETLNKEELENFSFAREIDGIRPSRLTDLAILTAIQNMQSYAGDYPFRSQNLYSEKKVFLETYAEYTLEHPTEIISGYYALLLSNQEENSLLNDHMDLNRLNDLFVNDDQYDKLKKYENALEKYAKNQSPIKTSASVKLAEIYNGYASRSKENGKIEEAKTWQMKALQLCEGALKIYPNSYGAKSCKMFIERLKNPMINVSLQTYLMSEKPIPVRITYKNTEWIRFKLYKISAEDFVKSQRHRGILMERELPLVWEEKTELPKQDDYFQHSIITLFPKVGKGFYLLRTETEKLPENLRNNYHYINVSDLATVTSPGEIDTKYQLVERNSGVNLNQGQVEKIKINYDYRTRKQSITYEIPQKMNKGRISIPISSRGNYLRFTYADDTLIVNFDYNIDYNRSIKERKNVQFITDRSIYRPGQIIHFKGILTSQNDDVFKPFPNEKIEVFLHGANYKQIAQRSFTTNAFGSVYGSFPIPENARPGHFRLRSQYGSTFIEVQYYKRPSFEAEFLSSDKLTKPGEEVELNLQVRSFAGSSIQNAVVETTVKIGPSFFRWWSGFFQSQVVDYIIDTTDAKGIANINFKSLPGNESQYYTITSKVTLPDGASNEFNHSYYVTPNPLNIGISDWSNFINEKKPEITISGINGEKVTENIELKIKALDYPDEYFYDMPFSTAEKILTDKSIWKNEFPGMAFNDNLKPQNMKSLKTTYEKQTDKGKIIFDDSFKLNEGWYAFEFYAGDTLNQTLYQKFSDSDYKKTKVPDPLTVFVDKDKVKPGETFKITMSSRFEDAQIQLLVNDKNGILQEEIVAVDGKKQHIEIQTNNDSEGRISISCILLAAGRSFSDQAHVEVIPVNRKINIEFTSIRNKITPGDEENWSLQLTKNDKPLQNAELVASMYDMSLDMFRLHRWSFPYQYVHNKQLMLKSSGFEMGSINSFKDLSKPYTEPTNWYLNSPFTSDRYRYRNGRAPMIEGAKTAEENMDITLEEAEADVSADDQDEEAFVAINEQDKVKEQEKKAQKQSVRTNFNETAFFYPTLKSDENGKVDVKFSAPQSMSKWKFQVFVHDKEMASGYAVKEVVTQKPLMVIPNRLRFVHQGDKVSMKAMVYNLTDSVIQVHPDIKFTNPYNGKRINASTKMRSINIDAKGNGSFTITFVVPEGLNALTYQIAGKSGKYTDGELHNIPVLPSRQRIINTLSLWVKPNSTKQYKFASIDKLKSETAKSHELTIELSTNPIWHAIKAMPAVFETNNNSAVQLARNFQVTSWSDYLIQNNPEIQQVFEIWKSAQPEALKSALSQKSDLRNLLLGETPWEEVAANEELQHAALMEMLNENFVQNQLSTTIDKIIEIQIENGAFSWRPGMRPSYYFTLQTAYKLSQTAELETYNKYNVQQPLSKALRYLKDEVEADYYRLMHYSADTSKYVTSSDKMLYFITQSNFNSKYQITSEAEKFYFNHAFRYQKQNLYQQVLSGILAKKYSNTKYAALILDRLKERATIDAEKGMFWRENQTGWNWDEAPIQTQALIATFLMEMNQPESELDAIKLWLVYEKQGQAWRNPDASLAAVKTLISTGSDWLNEKSSVSIKLGGLIIDSDKEAQQAGTGYFSKKIDQIDASMKDIEVKNPGKVPVWGGIYHSFTESFENIESHTDELSVERQIFVKTKTDKGEKVVQIDPVKDVLKVGDEVRVQLIIKSKRALDFVWVKAPHGACFEPKNQMSGYQWKSGKSYYEESHDSERRFFFNYLNNESIVVYYDLYVERSGVFNAGPVEIQSAYAPEFSAHSSGIEIKAEE